MKCKSMLIGLMTFWRWWLLILCLGAACCGGRLAAGTPEWDDKEKYVLQIVANGNIADLRYGSDSFRKFSHNFLRKLLTLPKDQVPPEGLHIRYALLEEDEYGDFTVPNLDVPYEVRFEHCEFRGKVNWLGCHFAKGLSFADSVFKSSARFERIQVDGHFDLRQTVFEQAFDAPYAQITGNLIGSGASFGGPASFKEISVGHSVDFSTLDTNQPTRFKQAADWSGSSVAHKFLAWKVGFDGKAQFDSMKVGGTVWMASCIFGGYASFGYSKIGDDFDATDCQFLKRANFYGLRCATLKMDSSLFNAEATFANAGIANDLSLCSVNFTSQTPVSFYAMEVKGSAFFNDTRFLGPANFILAHVGGNFTAIGAQFLNATNLNAVADSGTESQSTFNADFGSLAVDGFTFFNRTIFAGDVSFRNARLQNLVLDGVQWPPGTDRVRLEGLNYQRIRSVTNAVFRLNQEQLTESWDNLRGALQDHAPYSFEVYDNLEAYFRREGRPELADAAFIEGKRRERNEADLTAKCWSIFLDVTVGQGRDPARAFLISLAPLFVGAWIFRSANMRPADGKKKTDVIFYNSFWFSLDLFLPILDLWIKGKWEPRPDKKWVWVYACLHKFIGWVLVPVGLAAFAGIVK